MAVIKIRGVLVDMLVNLHLKSMDTYVQTDQKEEVPHHAMLECHLWNDGSQPIVFFENFRLNTVHAS
jgi:hypothetical protein